MARQRKSKLTVAESKNENPIEKQTHAKDTCEKKNNSSWSVFEIFKTFLKGVFLIIFIPAFLNYAALVKEEKAFEPEGFHIDVKHGQKLFKSCQGSGLPTVILDAPVGETSDIWSMIAPGIARITKVCTYDRAGLGYSERPIIGINDTKKSGKPHTVERMVEDFHRLFSIEEKPWILVGADLGATVAKFYTQLYQEGIVSLILVNPLFEGLFQGEENPWTKHWFHSHMPALQLKHISSALGLTRLGLQTGLFQDHFQHTETPDIVTKRQKYLRCKPGHMSSLIEESYFLNETLSQSRILHKLRPYPDKIPMYLIWSERYHDKITDELNRVWQRSREMFEKTLAVKPASNIFIHSSPPSLFFSKHHERITEIVRNSVQKWRKSSTNKY